MATKKSPIKKAARKTSAVERAQSTIRPAKSGPTFHPHFNSVEEELAYIYGSMTPEDDVSILYKAGILTPSGRLSSRFK